MGWPRWPQVRTPAGSCGGARPETSSCGSPHEDRTPVQAEPINVCLLDDHEIGEDGNKELLAGAGDIVVGGISGLAGEAVRRIPASARGDDPRRAAAGRVWDEDEALFHTSSRRCGGLLRSGRGDPAAEKTVQNYVSSVLDKVGLENRSQAAVLASTHIKD